MRLYLGHCDRAMPIGQAGDVAGSTSVFSAGRGWTVLKVAWRIGQSGTAPRISNHRCWVFNWERTYVSHETRVRRPLLPPIEGPLRVAVRRTLAPVDPMPKPGDPAPALSPSRAAAGPWSIASNSRRPTAVRSRYGRADGSRARGDRWFRVWSCPDHLKGLTGLRQFGSRREPWSKGVTTPAPVRHHGGRAEWPERPVVRALSYRGGRGEHLLGVLVWRGGRRGSPRSEGPVADGGATGTCNRCLW